MQAVVSQTKQEINVLDKMRLLRARYMMVGVDKFNLFAAKSYFVILTKPVNRVPGKGFISSNIAYVVKNMIDENIGIVREIGLG